MIGWDFALIRTYRTVLEYSFASDYFSGNEEYRHKKNLLEKNQNIPFNVWGAELGLDSDWLKEFNEEGNKYHRRKENAIEADLKSPFIGWDARTYSWKSNTSGLDWVCELIQEQRAVCLLDGYYPSYIAARKKDIWEKIAAKPPAAREKHEWIDGHLISSLREWSERELNLFNEIPPDEYLIIRIWDQS